MYVLLGGGGEGMLTPVSRSGRAGRECLFRGQNRLLPMTSGVRRRFLGEATKLKVVSGVRGLSY